MSIVFRSISVIFFICVVSIQQVAAIKKYYLSPKEIEVIKHELPSRDNLLVYLTLLNRIIEYCNKEKYSLSGNLIFGLFLINVNLEQFVNDHALPLDLRSRLGRLLTHSAKLQHDYYKKPGKDSQNRNLKKMLGNLCANATAWSSRVMKMNLDLLRIPYLNIQYMEWSRYNVTVKDFDKGTPNPSLSDKCMTSLAESEENRSKINSMRCEIENECYNAIIFGTNYGYWLTHRLIYLQHARLSRGCSIFSPQDDGLLRVAFCGMAYKEVEYNALNGFQIADLVFEQIALCSLEGHAQFLRKTWLSNLLERQNQNGCFELLKDDTIQSDNYFRSPPPITTEKCNFHTMAVAAGAYAGAVRFILENY